jgi:hypothetical protein
VGLGDNGESDQLPSVRSGSHSEECSFCFGRYPMSRKIRKDWPSMQPVRTSIERKDTRSVSLGIPSRILDEAQIHQRS